ncbi:unnamed protein product [Larinioides sclopetarius]|uniref:Uncharacterized protein n=1 Tax=Larinioides sclopetarius TaxID=280406 RepID=A0AAV2BAA2_9ARAC
MQNEKYPSILSRTGPMSRYIATIFGTSQGEKKTNKIVLYKTQLNEGRISCASRDPQCHCPLRPLRGKFLFPGKKRERGERGKTGHFWSAREEYLAKISTDGFFEKTEPEKPVAGFSEPFFRGGGGRVAQNQDSGGLDQKVACDCRCAHDVTGPYRAAHAHTPQPTAVIYRVRVDHGKWNPLSLEAKRGHLEFPPGIES